MYDQIIVWTGLVLLLVLCLPFARIQKLLLEVYAFALRLALLALLVGAGFLWFYPDRLPPEVTATFDNFPPLRSILPEPGTPIFGVCAAGLVVAMLLPFLAILDVTRKLAGRRLSRLRALSAGRVVTESPPPAPSAPQSPPPAVSQEPSPAPRHADRRTAAETLAVVGSRKPFRYAGPQR